MTSPSEDVYEAAARALDDAGGWNRPVTAVRAAVDVGFAAGVAAGRVQAAADIRAVDVGRIADLEGDWAHVGLTVAARIAEGGELQ